MSNHLIDPHAERAMLTKRFENTAGEGSDSANMRDLRNKWTRMPGIVGLKVGYETYGAQADMDYIEERMRIENNRFEIEELEWPNEGDGSIGSDVLIAHQPHERQRPLVAHERDALRRHAQNVCDLGKCQRLSLRHTPTPSHSGDAMLRCTVGA